MLKKLLTGAIIYSLLPQLPKVITIFTYPVLTRYLTAEDYGIYGITTAYVGLTTILKDLGFTLVFINIYYKHRENYGIIWRHLHGLLYLWSFIYCLLLAGMLALAIPDQAMKNFWPIIVLSVVPNFLFENVQVLSSIYYRIKEKPWPVSLISVVGGLATVLITIVSVVYFNSGYMGWFYASFAASALMFLFHVYHLYIKNKLLPIFKIRRQYIKKYFKVGGPMILHDYSSYLLNTSDRVVMSVLNVKVNQIGFYNIAYTFGSFFAFFETAMGMASAPIFLRYYSENKIEEARRLTFISQTIFLLASFTTCLWLKEIFYLLVKNDELRTAYSLGIIIIMGYNYKPMYQAATNVLFYKERTFSILKISFVAGMLNIILNFILVPFFGIYAAAYTTLGCLLFMGFRGFYLKEYRDTKPLEYYPLRWLLTILLTTLVVYLLKDIAMLYKIFITALLGLATLAFTYRNRQILMQN